MAAKPVLATGSMEMPRPHGPLDALVTAARFAVNLGRALLCAVLLGTLD